MKTLFGASALVAGAAVVEIAAVAGDGAAGGALNAKGLPFDGAVGFGGSAAGG